MLKGGDRRSTFTLSISKQYGASSILIACLVLGTWIGRTLNAKVALLVGTVLFAFLARHAADVYLGLPKTDKRRRGILTWTVAYSLVFLGVGGLLVVVNTLWFLLLFGLLALVLGSTTLVLSQQRKETAIGGDLIGILGLTVAAPAAESTAQGIISSQTISLWMLCIFFFCGSVFHVRYLARKRMESKGPPFVRLKAGLPSVAYHLSILAASFVLGPVAGLFPYLAPIALLPVTSKALLSVGLRVKKASPIRLIGYTEVIHTLVFMALAGAAFLIN